MPKIRQLDSHVADLIAAGEVVERPASAVKELMENSIDAGATTITVEIQRGGMSYIRVTDNGCGIAPEDTELAFLRHATSKIHEESDLEAIGTLGFRGEALAAIAAVSHVELLTRQPQDEFGTCLELDAGVVTKKEEAGCPAGTTIIVRDLFFNTPARLKFMKKDASEGAAVSSVVQHTALSHPEIAVTFLKEGKKELQTSGDGQLKSALYAVLGRDTALGYLPVKGTGAGMTVEGYVSMPACCRGTRGYQHFFVNGRYVRSKTMTAALEEAYRNQKMVGKFPGCVLHIHTKLNAVDVNVHPTKTEVKFANDRALFDAVYYSVKAALEGTAPRLELELETQEPGEEAGAGSAARTRAATAPGETPERTAPAQSRAHAAPAAASSSAAASAAWPRKQNFFQSMTTAEYRALAAEQERKARQASSSPLSGLRAEQEEDRTPFHPEEAPAREQAAQEQTVRAPAHRVQEPEAQEQAAQEPEEEEKRPAEEAAPLREEAESGPESAAAEPWSIAGELFNTYILVEQGDRVVLIDKHAAHERMNFDRLKAQGYRPMAQELLTPVVFTPAAEEGRALLDNLELLKEFGFECEDFGDGAVLVREIPGDIPEEETEATLTELAGKLLTEGTADPDSARDDLLHTIACKAAIKGGQQNGPEELQKVAEAVMNDEVRYCPHGRPVAIELTRKQLEKQFRRST